MQTRQELILDFMKTLASSPVYKELHDELDESLAARKIYLVAAKLADTFLEFQG